jgi:hypothetical protein
MAVSLIGSLVNLLAELCVRGDKTGNMRWRIHHVALFHIWINSKLRGDSGNGAFPSVSII